MDLYDIGIFEDNIDLPIKTKKEKLAKYIIKIMQTRKISRGELAEKLGRRPSEITKWLLGTHNFTIETLFLLERALGIQIINLGDLKPSPITVKSCTIFFKEPFLNLIQLDPLFLNLYNQSIPTGTRFYTCKIETSK